MARQSEGIGELLLSRLPRPENLASYHEEVRSLLAKNQETLRRNKWTVRRVWIFVILFSIPCLWAAGVHFNTPQGNWFLGGVFFWVLFGTIEIAKYEQNRGRVEVLKEIKQLQLQVLALQAALTTPDTPGSDRP